MNRRLLNCTVLAANCLFIPRTLASEIKLDLPATLAKAQKEYGPLLAFSHTERAAQGIIQKATRFPNPEFAFSWEDFLRSEDRDVQPGQFHFELQMPLEVGGKRSAREESAVAEENLVTLETEKQKSELIVGIASAFLDLKEKEALIKLAQERQRLASRLAEIASQKLKAGKLSGVEQGRLASLATLAEIELGERELDVKNASKRAAIYIGKSSVEAETFYFPFESSPEVSFLPSKDWSQTIAARIADAKTKKALSDVSVAGKEAIPDLTLRAGTTYDRTSKEKSFTVGFSLPLPLFDRNQGGRKQAQALNDIEQARGRSAEPEVVSDISEAANSLEFSRAKALQLKNEILPKLRESAALLAEAYDRGRVTYLELVEVQESLFSVEEKYVKTQAQFHRSVFKLAFASQVSVGLEKIGALYSFEANK